MKKWEQCWECGRDMQRCRPVYTQQNGEVAWVCRQCWRDLDFDGYLYEHRVEKR